jgi:hypothetical protein
MTVFSNLSWIKLTRMVTSLLRSAYQCPLGGRVAEALR